VNLDKPPHFYKQHLQIVFEFPVKTTVKFHLDPDDPETLRVTGGRLKENLIKSVFTILRPGSNAPDKMGRLISYIEVRRETR
jgi:hypothetical protein